MKQDHEISPFHASQKGNDWADTLLHEVFVTISAGFRAFARNKPRVPAFSTQRPERKRHARDRLDDDRLPESLLALAAAMAMVLTGTIGEDKLYAALGSDLVWLLLAAFIIATVIKNAGLAERMVAPLTALVLPFTSGRAAFLALVPLLSNARLTLARALIFPTVILLSAGGSLIGAGGGELFWLHRIETSGVDPRLGRVRIECLAWHLGQDHQGHRRRLPLRRSCAA